MKSLWSSILIVAGIVLIVGLCSGCRTTTADGSQSEWMNPTRIQAVSKLAAYAGTTAYLQAHPEQRPALEAASAGLQGLVAQERWDATAVATVLAGAGITELQGSEGALALTGGLMLIDAFGLGEYDAQNSEHVKAAVLGVAEGVRLALIARAYVRDHNVTEWWLEQLRAEAEATRTLPVTRR